MVTSINIHVCLCSRRPPVFIKAVLPLPFASRVLWKDIPDLTDVAEVESMCFPPTDASAAVCSSFIMHACSQKLHSVSRAEISGKIFLLSTFRRLPSSTTVASFVVGVLLFCVTCHKSSHPARNPVMIARAANPGGSHSIF